jgi:UDP-N-acetylmuramate dehydrogenase
MKIEKNFDIGAKTFFRVGGLVKYYAEIESISDLEKLREKISEFDNLPKLVIGACSNILISDNGYAGIVIKNCIQKIDWLENNQVIVGAGEMLPKVAYELAKKGLVGFEHLGNIPGTVGGGIRGNVEAYEQSISDKLVSVLWCDFAGECESIAKDKCGFSYRESKFKNDWDGKGMIIEAKFGLEDANKDILLGVIESDRKRRMESQPSQWSCGCFFKNVYLNQENYKLIEKKWGAEILKNRNIGDFFSAGLVIDKLSLKGKKRGGAQVSEKHANFIVNTGSAKAIDIYLLYKEVQTQVFEETGIELINEVQIVGDFIV